MSKFAQAQRRGTVRSGAAEAFYGAPTVLVSEVGGNPYLELEWGGLNPDTWHWERNFNNEGWVEFATELGSTLDTLDNGINTPGPSPVAYRVRGKWGASFGIYSPSSSTTGSEA